MAPDEEISQSYIFLPFLLPLYKENIDIVKFGK